ncbi:rRNA processing/ribosome biogenesis-domain-containing protein [Myxozyma melibiosi]|uniref:Pre-rRNA-processing protein RIX1 n=1 Tax=Myxozyma melibiosi TaxID=54550 RepID=A0ABR1F680_9ASCO
MSAAALSSQLRTCLVTTLAPETEPTLHTRLGSAALCLSSHAIISSSDPQILHRVRVRLSAMLQSSKSDVRRSGAELVNALIGVEWESMNSHGLTWMKLLVSILEKRVDGYDTLEAVVGAIRKILSRIKDKPTLIREIATPHIPAYASALLSLASPEHDILTKRALLIALPAFLDLIRNFSNTFRPFVSKVMNNIVYPTLNSSAWTQTPVDLQIESLCGSIYASIYLTAPKDQLREWQISILKIVDEAHKTISQTFGIVQQDAKYSESASGWEMTVDIRDTYTGVLRLEMLFRLLQTVLTTETKGPVQVPLSKIIDLADRLLDMEIDLIEFKDTSERQDRDFILTVLPVVHGNAYNLLNTTAHAVGQAMLPYTEKVFSHLRSVKLVPSSLFAIPIFEFVTNFTTLMRFVPDDFTQELTHIIELALTSLEPINESSTLADFFSHPSAFVTQPPSELRLPVLRLLHAVVNAMPGLPATTRSRIDRFALMMLNTPSSATEEERLLLATVLQPGNNIRWSILPMVSRKIPESEALGALIHPRFPPMPKRKEEIEATASVEALKSLKAQAVKEEGSDAESGDEEMADDEDDESRVKLEELVVKPGTQSAAETAEPTTSASAAPSVSSILKHIPDSSDKVLQTSSAPAPVPKEHISSSEEPQTSSLPISQQLGAQKRAAEDDAAADSSPKRPRSDDEGAVSTPVAATTTKTTVGTIPVAEEEDEGDEDEDFEMPELNTELSSDDEE